MKAQPFHVLLKWILTEYEENQSIFGIHSSLFYTPHKDSPYAGMEFGQYLATPLGPAAGPHTQLTQNIICSWLSGGRFIELKTVQIMDELEIPRPCIEMEDEGYNVEWSQELKLEQSASEYCKAWVLIHILHRLLGFEKVGHVGTVFNMSVGYNLEGIKSLEMTSFMDKMINGSKEIAQIKSILQEEFPQFADIEIPAQITNNVTLSTMHGCPPEEIEQIARYLMEEKGLHTTIKLNPTLLGKEVLGRMIRDDLGYRDIKILDTVFEHDLQYDRALQLIKTLQEIAAKEKLIFGIKLSNTLPVANHKGYLPGDEMYMSGRVLYPIAINLYHKLMQDVTGELKVSYSAGADAINIVDILATGTRPITLVTDLLKPGGYSRLVPCLENIESEMKFRGYENLEQLASNKLSNLEQAASEALLNKRYKKSYHPYPLPKVNSPLPMFDCIAAPCREGCAICQDIPDYAWAMANGQWDQALEIILARNPLPGVTGYICTQLCQRVCTRNHYDEPVGIRDLKKFAALNGNVTLRTKDKNNKRVAVIGSNPMGLSAAFFLALNGVEVVIFEAGLQGTGITGIPPKMVIPQEVIQKDLERIINMGVTIAYSQLIEKPEKLLQAGFDDVYVAFDTEVMTKPKIIIQACADGRQAAEEICRKMGIVLEEESDSILLFSPEEILAMKNLRRRIEIRQRPQRAAIENCTEDEARREAARCMQCSTFCDKCVEVCPNRANYTYVASPQSIMLPIVAYENGRLVVAGEELFKVNQTRQIIHLDDFCNECGNCTSFCVHHGKPYMDKPRLFLRRGDFEREDNNAFYIEDNTILRREGGRESKLAMGQDGVVFSNYLVRIHLSPTFKMKEMNLKRPFGGTLSLREAAEMALIFKGIRTSLLFLPLGSN